MSLPTVTGASYPTHEETRDGILRGIAYAFSRRNLTANVLPGSDHYIRADVYARRVMVAVTNNKLAIADSNPLTATGTALRTLCRIFGVEERAAASASGYVTLQVTSGTVSLTSGWQGTSGAGLKYQVTQTYIGLTNGAKVQVQAVAAGASTDMAAGLVLVWDSASIGNLKPEATVDAGGITGGRDGDTDETLRTRLLDRLAFPASGDNWAQVYQNAKDASSSVIYAWVYPAVRGAASFDVAIASDESDRTLTTAVQSVVTSYINGRMNGGMRVNVTTVSEQQVDVILSASLPLPESMGGAGGGWRDPTPWPAETCKITAYNSGTGIATVNSTATPTAGNRIGIWDTTPTDRADWAMLEYTVGPTIGGVSGAWTFDVVGGFSATPLAAYVSAGAENLVDYADAFRTLMLTLGCGEKTSNTDILPQGRRRPGPDEQDPSDLTYQLIRAMLTDRPEFLDLQYAARYLTGTTTTQTSPSVATTTADAPRVFTLKHFAIRKA